VCEPATQLARLIERGMSEKDARQRIDAQWPSDEKVRRAHFVIQTDGSRQDTERQVESFLAELGI
jgi:dephospho-CoA kinase